jgi:hypothetical protein
VRHVPEFGRTVAGLRKVENRSFFSFKLESYKSESASSLNAEAVLKLLQLNKGDGDRELCKASSRSAFCINRLGDSESVRSKKLSRRFDSPQLGRLKAASAAGCSLSTFRGVVSVASGTALHMSTPAWLPVRGLEHSDTSGTTLR